MKLYNFCMPTPIIQHGHVRGNKDRIVTDYIYETINIDLVRSKTLHAL